MLEAGPSDRLEFNHTPGRSVIFSNKMTGPTTQNPTLIYTGDVDWCTTVKPETREQILASPPWQYWGGWLRAADTGEWKRRIKTNYPIVGAVTPTAGGLVFFGDVGGIFYAVDASNDEKLWGQKMSGPRRRRDHLYSQRRAESRGDLHRHISSLAG